MRSALPAERKAMLFEYVRSSVIEVLGFDSGHRLDPEQGLFDLGMDSLTAVELKNRLQAAIGNSLPSTLLFDYPNVQALTEYLGREVLQWKETATGPNDSHGGTDAPEKAIFPKTSWRGFSQRSLSRCGENNPMRLRAETTR